MKKRTFTKEFKLQAVALAKSLGNINAAARQLGILDSCIHNWKNKYQSSESAGPGPSPLNSIEFEELKRLRRETDEQKKVIQILKAAAAFFSQDHLK
jgi:transposase